MKTYLYSFIAYLIFIFSSTTTLAQNFTYEWAKSFGGIKSESATNMTTDDQGNLYIVGYSWGEISFDSYDLTGPVDFLVKMDNEGNTLWTTGIFNASTMLGGVVVDSEYNVYVSGYFIGSFVFNEDTIESQGFYDIFVAKYDSNGNPLWIRSGGGEGYEMQASITIDSENNLYLLSYHSSPTFTIHNTVLTNEGGSQGVLCKFDEEGDILWVKQIDSYWIAGLAVDQTDNVIIGGDFSNMEFGNSLLTIHPEAWGAACFIIYNKNGEELWGKCVGGEDESWTATYTFRIDDEGNIYLVGTYDSEITFDDVVLSSPPPDPYDSEYNVEYMFIAKFNIEGNIEWVTHIAGDYTEVMGFRKRNSEFYFKGVAWSSSVQLGSTTLNGDEDEGIHFFSKISDNGEFIWAYIIESDEYFNTFLPINQNDMIIAGSFSGSTTLGETTLTSAGESDIFLAKMVESTVGLKKIEAPRKFTLYPNPFSTQAVLFSDKELHNATMIITNALGQVVRKIDNLSGQEITIDRKNLPLGIYFINVFEKDKTLSSKKFIVQ